ncbi:MAG: DMT family transporter [Actinobacteria bacterium]|nr:DMT family transporter [Actinomycetota bacterium]MBI3687371.1 DMT family transporter [Actinomycetota bacterium]
MRTGLLAAVGAGLLWGLAFVIPEQLNTVSAAELTAGRYLSYGLLSLALVLLMGADQRATLDRSAWTVALGFAGTGNIGYYLLLVVAVRHAGAPLAALIIGTLPLTVAVVGGLRDQRLRLRRLAVPLTFTAVGLLLVNAAAFTHRGAPGTGVPGAGGTGQFAIGVLAAVGGLACWTWYAVANADFLARRPEVAATTWASAVGVGTLLLAVLTTPLVLAGGRSTIRAHLLAFVAASLVLGLVVSWLATVLWNRATARLPTVLAGQLIVVETISGSTYSFVARSALPDPLTLAGFVLVVLGVIGAMRRVRG